MRSLRATVARAGWMLLAVVPAVAGCRERAPRSPDEVATAAWPKAPSEGFAVLPWGTRVYLEPRYGGASARLGWPGMPPPPWPTPGYVARVVGARDGFVEIAPVMPPVQPHCGPLLDGEAAFDVRLYVSPWALAAVLVREVEAALDDGSTLTLRPGAVAQPIPHDPRGRWAIAAGGLRVRAVLPADATGRGYPGLVPFSTAAGGGWQLPPPGRTSFTYDGLPLELELGFGQDVAIASVTPHHDGHLVELVSPCARVLAQAAQPPVAWQPEPRFTEFGLAAPGVVVPPHVLAAVGLEPPPPEGEPPPAAVLEAIEVGAVAEEFGGLGLLGPGSATPARREHTFEEGTPIYLSVAGPVAGTLAQLRVFGEDGWRAGDRLCFHTTFGASFDPMLPVCLPAAEARLRDPAVDVHDFSAGLVRPEALRVTGTLPHAAVEAALRRHRGDLRRCLDEAMMQGIPATGGFELALDVDGRGTITRVTPRSSLAAVLTDCAVAAARGWTMPAPDDGTPAQVVFSVRFETR